MESCAPPVPVLYPQQARPAPRPVAARECTPSARPCGRSFAPQSCSLRTAPVASLRLFAHPSSARLQLCVLGVAACTWVTASFLSSVVRAKRLFPKSEKSSTGRSKMFWRGWLLWLLCLGGTTFSCCCKKFCSWLRDGFFALRVKLSSVGYVCRFRVALTDFAPKRLVVHAAKGALANTRKRTRAPRAGAMLSDVGVFFGYQNGLLKV